MSKSFSPRQLHLLRIAVVERAARLYRLADGTHVAGHRLTYRSQAAEYEALLVSLAMRESEEEDSDHA